MTKKIQKLSVVLVISLFLFTNAGVWVATSSSSGEAARLQAYWMNAYRSSRPGGEAVLFPALLAKAEPDECYDGIGNAYPPGPPCATGEPKVNQAYVWGLTMAQGDLWFGTAPNVHCLVLGSFLSLTTPHETESWVCEFGESQYSPPLPEVAGDWRPPHIYVFDPQLQQLTEKTPADVLIETTLGIRSGGSLGPVVMLGGPSLVQGVNLFAFNATDGEYLGSTTLTEYTNIRKWLVEDGVLYTAMRSAQGGGRVLRWQGNLADPFQFEVVGNLDSEGVELAVHEGRLFVSTWPELQGGSPDLAGLYMSPPIPPGGLTALDADQWTKVWEVSDYEPDPVTAAVYGGGALASFDGHLFWGTMHVPLLATFAHFAVYGQPDNILETVAALSGTQRAISIFRGRNFGQGDEEIDLLYGAGTLPAYFYDPVNDVGSWQLVPNMMAEDPLWGSGGFDNFYNNYTWTMAVYQGQLYVGTMDWSYLIPEGLPIFLESLFGIPADFDLQLPQADYGADLMRFPAADSPAVVESVDGVGNYANYGIRTMVSADFLYLGMANPMNRMTDPNDDLPEGGWELLRLGAPFILVFPIAIR